MAFPLGVKKAPKGALRTIKNRPFLGRFKNQYSFLSLTI